MFLSSVLQMAHMKLLGYSSLLKASFICGRRLSHLSEILIFRVTWPKKIYNRQIQLRKGNVRLCSVGISFSTLASSLTELNGDGVDISMLEAKRLGSFSRLQPLLTGTAVSGSAPLGDDVSVGGGNTRLRLPFSTTKKPFCFFFLRLLLRVGDSGRRVMEESCL